MRRLAIALLSLLLLCAAHTTPAAPLPVGRWLTAGGEAVIEIAACGTGLCGRIIGVTLDNPSDPEPTDIYGHPQCGLPIIAKTMPAGGNLWRGEILDPTTGHSYAMEISMESSDVLRLRGYIGLPLFGSTQLWHRFNGSIAANCHFHQRADAPLPGGREP
jgi:uncharacterized protein (DUF2147 family)